MTPTKWMLICLVLVVASASLASQESPPTSIPKFTARTELVTVPVVIFRRGSPWRQIEIAGWLDEHVPGLTKDDFQIFEDGEPRPIASFEEFRESTAKVKRVTPLPGVYTNEVVSEGPVNMVVILLDLLNTPYQFQESTKKRLLEFLQRDFRGDRPAMLAVLHPGGLHILHDFTTNPEVLVNIARRLKGSHEHDPALDDQWQKAFSGELYKEIDVTQEYAEMEREFMGDSTISETYERRVYETRLETTFQELQELARSLAGVRGMKTLVWTSGGISLPTAMHFRAFELQQMYLHTLQLLSAADVAVYPIDTILETDNPVFASPQSPYPTMGQSKVQIVQNFMDIAHRTGGDYCLLRKDPDLCFRKAVGYNSDHYLLSYYTRSPETARWRKIEVKVRGADLEVRARNGYFSYGTYGDPVKRRTSDIAQALISPLDSRSLPLSVRWVGEAPAARTRATGSGEPQLTKRRPKYEFMLGIRSDAVTVDAADNNHIQLEVIAIALDRDGKPLADVNHQVDLHPHAADMERLRKGGFAYSGAIEVPPKTAKVRFIVRDNQSERLGTVSVPIEVRP